MKITQELLDETLATVRRRSREHDQTPATYTLSAGKPWPGFWESMKRGDPQSSKNAKFVFTFPKAKK